MTNRILLIIGNVLIFSGLAGMASAQSLQSSNYRIDESYIGPGGSVQSSSANYKENSTVGDIGVGNSSSTNFQTVAGYNTTNDPNLSVVVSTSSINFGSFSTSVPVTATSTFKVLNYTSSGYSVFTIGSPPANNSGGHALCGMSAGGCSGNTSSAGSEQFGINLSGPNNVGAGNFGSIPVQVPSSSFSYGAASANYNTANQFRYVNGEQIAGATKTSGETDYTISYLVNVATTTPGGKYSGNQTLVVVGTY